MAAAAALASLTISAGAELTVQKFYADDPLMGEPAPRPVKQVATRKVDDIYDFVENSYVTPGREGKAANRTPRPALDVNTLGEVPNSAWYTNRHGSHRMSIVDLERGPGNSTPPSREGGWKIVAAKSDGVTPGFVIEDTEKHRYLLKFDPPGSPELCSAADVIGSKFFYALGYFTPENYIVYFHRENFIIPPDATWRDGTGRRRPLTSEAIGDLLKGQVRTSRGYRAVASRWVEGQPIGPFSYRGVRTDDPNDIVPHEDRRVLRGLGVFAAWLNHQDTRSINTMDTLAGSDGHKFIRHYLIDFGSILGSAGYGPKMPWMGHEHTIARREALKQAVTLGVLVPRWDRAHYPNWTGVGVLDHWSFDPVRWRPAYPNPAFLLMDAKDAFWAAKQVAAFTDDEIRAIVRTGQYSDSRATDWVAECLIRRRDKIAEAWFAKVLPLDGFRIAGGHLAFDDLGAEYAQAKPRDYTIQWAAYDNHLGIATPIAGASGPGVPAGEQARYLAATVSCKGDGPCANPVTVYLRRTAMNFDVIGIDR